MTDEGAGIRAQLAKGTACPHLILHGHPDIGRLMSDDLDRLKYGQILRFFLTLYKAAETRRARLAAWSDYSLAPEVHALETDLGITGAVSAHDENMHWVVCPASCIGMLYVLHGAGIGGKLIARNLSLVLPDAPREFFSRGVKPAVWQGLIDALETYQGKPADYDLILQSATRTFEAFNRRVATASLA